MSISARAVCIREPGGPEVLHLDDVEVRDPEAGEVRVRVEASGLNRADVLQRKGFYPAPPGVAADIPGLEYAGVVESVGADAGRWSVGDRVMGIVGGGGMCTHVVVHETEALAIPEGWSMSDAAAVPEAGLTAFDAIYAQGRLGPGETALIHSVGSGVGTAAFQMVQALGGVAVGTSRTQWKLDRCVEMGLQHAVLAQDGAFVDGVRAAVGKSGAHVILDTVGAAYLSDNARVLAHRGRWVVIGLLGGAKGTLPLGPILAKRGTLMGSVLRSRSLEEKAALVAGYDDYILPLLRGGQIRPVVDEVLPMTAVQRAHERMEENSTFGKIVLQWTEESLGG